MGMTSPGARRPFAMGGAGPVRGLLGGKDLTGRFVDFSKVRAPGLSVFVWANKRLDSGLVHSLTFSLAVRLVPLLSVASPRPKERRPRPGAGAHPCVDTSAFRRPPCRTICALPWGRLVASAPWQVKTSPMPG